MKKKLLLLLALVLVVATFAACAIDAKDEPVVEDVESEVVETVEETNEEQTEETSTEAEETQTEELGILEGFAENTSFDNSTAFKTHELFANFKVEGTFEDGIQALLDAGFIEREAPEDNYVGGLIGEYALEDEQDVAYVTINKNGDGNFDVLQYIILYPEDTTGFHASNEVYQAILAEIDAGTVNNLADLESYFGKGYLCYQEKASDGTEEYHYAWRNKWNIIYCMVDADMNLVSYKIACNSLPEVYEE